MGTPQDPGAVFNMLWAGNNQLFSEIAAQFPDGAATAFTVGVGLAMLAGQCALSAYFSFIATSGPWHAMPGFTAHQLIYCERLTCPAAPTPHHTPLSAPHHTRLPRPSAPHPAAARAWQSLSRCTRHTSVVRAGSARTPRRPPSASSARMLWGCTSRSSSSPSCCSGTYLPGSSSRHCATR